MAVDDTQSLYKVINKFINDEAETEKQVVSRPSLGGQFYNRKDVIKALSNIQLSFQPEYVPGQKVNINTDSFKSSLLNSMAKLTDTATPRSINQIDGRTIDFVEMIFGAFLRDKNTSDAIKSLLLQLQVPVIKTSLLDSKFFYNDSHPARILLDTIAHLGIGIEDRENTLYKTMGLIINQLLRSFDENIVSFRTAISALDRLSEIEKKKLIQNEQQTKKLIFKEHARQLVLTELQFHLMHVTLPPSFQPLILNHWSTLMFHHYVKYGTDSKEWSLVTDVLATLGNTLKPIESKQEWLYVNNTYPGLVDTIEAELSTTNQNKEKIYLGIRNLNNHYVNLLNSSAFEHDENDTLIEEPQSFQKEESPAEKKAEISRQKIELLPKSVKINNWYEVFTGIDSSVRRLKLSVIIEEEAALIFVDRHGTKVMVKDAEDFSYELQCKQSRMINDHSVFDSALTQVIQSLASK